jgi:hypothetical protein
VRVVVSLVVLRFLYLIIDYPAALQVHNPELSIRVDRRRSILVSFQLRTLVEVRDVGFFSEQSLQVRQEKACPRAVDDLSLQKWNENIGKCHVFVASFQ